MTLARARGRQHRPQDPPGRRFGTLGARARTVGATSVPELDPRSSTSRTNRPGVAGGTEGRAGSGRGRAAPALVKLARFLGEHGSEPHLRQSGDASESEPERAR